MICKITGRKLDPIDAIECGAVCEICPIAGGDPIDRDPTREIASEHRAGERDENSPFQHENPPFPANLLPIFEETDADPAQKKDRSRQKRWDRKGIRTVSARVPTRTAERFAAYCAAQGKTRNQVIREWIRDALAPVPGMSTVHKIHRDRWGKI